MELLTKPNFARALAIDDAALALPGFDPPHAPVSRAAIERVQELLPYRKVRILGVGMGSVPFVRELSALGYQRLALLNVSAPGAIRAPTERPGGVQWIDRGLSQFLPALPFSLWYDAGVFRGLGSLSARLTYGHAVWNSLLPGGLALIEAAEDSGQAIAEALGPAFLVRGCAATGEPSGAFLVERY